MKKIFSIKLYAEGLRRIRTQLIVFLALSAVTSLSASLLFASWREMSGGALAFFGIPFYVICVPMMTVRMFSFLNNRPGSDLFHSLPYRRECVFLSLLSALVSGIVCVISALGAFSYLFYLIFTHNKGLAPGSLILFLLACLAASLLVAAIVLVTMTVSGTVFVELILSVIIALLPHLLLYLMECLIRSSVFSCKVDAALLPFSGIENNLIFGIIEFFNISPTVTSIIYTSALSLVYFIAGSILFRFRKSETAGHPAPSKGLQSAFRIAAACSISFIATMFFAERIFNNYTVKLSAGILVAYIFSAVVYFLYEIISTKSWKSVLKSLPVFGAVILLNVCVFGACFGVYRAESDFAASPGSITDVKFRIMNFDSNRWTVSDYAKSVCRSEGVRIDDREILDELSAIIKKQNEKRDRIYTPDKVGSLRDLTLDVKCGAMTKPRRIFVSKELSVRIYDYLAVTETYKNALRALPYPAGDPSVSGVSIYDGGEITGKVIDHDEMVKIITTLNAELETVDPVEWEELNGERYEELNEIVYSFGNGVNTLAVKFSKELTPKTYAAVRKAAGVAD